MPTWGGMTNLTALCYKNRSTVKDELGSCKSTCSLLTIIFLRNMDRWLSYVVLCFENIEQKNKRKQSIRLLSTFQAECSSPVLICLPSFEIFVSWQSCKKLQVYGDQAFDSTTNQILGTSHKFNYAYNRK